MVPTVIPTSIFLATVLHCVLRSPNLESTMPDDIYEHDAIESSTGVTVKLQMLNLHLHSSGVFSNVYRGTLMQPEPRREIAVKKTWPDPTVVGHKNMEYLMLQALSREKHKNIVQVLFTYQNVAADKRICESMVFDFMPSTLSSLIKRLGPPNADLIDIKLYTWQLFNGLYYLMKRKICHRDIKPQNLLVDDAAGVLKIGDFGSAKVIRTETRSTPYQVTRFYRPPELLMGAQEYGSYVDVWSAGCVMGEMLRGKVLLPGCDSQQQLTLIVRALGVPDPETLVVMKVILDVSPISLQTDVPFRGLDYCLPSVPKEYVRFVQRILTYRPQERLCGRELLLDPFFEELFTPAAKRSNAQLISTIIAPEDVEVIRNPPRKRSRNDSNTKEDTSKSLQPMPDPTKPTRPAQGTPTVAPGAAGAAKPQVLMQTKKTRKTKASRDQTMSRESTTTTNEDQLNTGGSKESVESQANAAKTTKPTALKTKP